MSTNNPLMIAVTTVSTLIGGGGLYFQWLDHNNVESNTTQVVTAKIPNETQEIVEKSVMAEISHQSKLNENQPTQLATSQLKQDDLPKKEQKPVKQATVDDLELPTAKDFDDFDKSSF